jgi:tellurite resistance protein TerA
MSSEKGKDKKWTSRGQRLKLEALGLADAAFSVTVELNAGPLTVDVACFGLDGARKLSDERYMTFFNQPTTPCGAVKLKGQGKFDLDLARLPASIDALVMTLAIDGSGTMRQLGASSVSLIGGSTVAGCYRFDGDTSPPSVLSCFLSSIGRTGSGGFVPWARGLTVGLMHW